MFDPKSRSRRSRFLFILFLGLMVVLGFHLFAPLAVLAAPGGKIASAIFRSFWGRILLATLILIFAPFILYTYIVESLAERRTQRDLKRLSQLSPQFDWIPLKERITECFHRVHSAWHKEDMQQAAQWMTDWYWQNQQIAYLDRWEESGLVNHCNVGSLKYIQPLFLRVCDRAQSHHEPSYDGSRLAVAITANLEDYLAERETGKVVRGEKGYSDMTAVWTFQLKDGQWIVANIEEDSMTMTYAKMVNEIPHLFSEKNARIPHKESN
jgi:Tim44-like domain